MVAKIEDHVPLDAILCNEELARRPAREPDYVAENRALAALMQALADSPDTILQVLADTILEVFDADSAGLSLLRTEDGEERFYWPAIAGEWKAHVGGGTPRHFGPCGDVLDHDAPLLFKHFELRYPYLRGVMPAAEEALLIPFYVDGRAVGTIWAMVHDSRRAFDKEDLRQLESLGRFAAAAYQAIHAREADAARRAALELMEEAIRARRAVEEVNAQIRERERRFREMIDALPAAVYTTDAQGRLTHFNPAAVAFAGREPVLGADRWCVSWKLYHADGTPMPHDTCPMAIVLRENRPVEGMEAIAERPDGTRVWFAPFPTALRNDAGEVIGGINMLVDITERKKAEMALRESEERFRTLANHIPQLAWISDTNGAAYWFNERWYQYTGTTPEEVLGDGSRTLHHPDHIERIRASWRRALARGELWEDTLPLRNKDGGYRWFLSRAVPIRDSEGRVQRWFGSHTDITEHREMARELRRSLDDLATADRRKNEFLATLAHELRGPLAPIQNALQLMRLSADGARAHPKGIEMIERQVAHMVRLVDDLLDVSRISRGTVELRLERVDLASIIDVAVETARPAFAEKGVDLFVTMPPRPIALHGDATRLTQVFGNLLNNARKFTAEGGRVDVSVELKDGEAVIRVGDTGIGIAADQLPHIFDLFTLGDSSLERAESGLGIGLTLVRDLVTQHGGRVRARSPGIGQGTEIEVRLPMLPDAGATTSAQSPTSESAPVGPRRILVVDDHWDSATSMAMLLEASGHEVRTAHDGIAAVEAAEAFRPDMVLLDIGLPRMNGYDAARAMRERPWGADVVLVALTGWGQDEDRQKSKEAGFDEHLVKPVDYTRLMRVLASYPVRSEQAKAASS